MNETHVIVGAGLAGATAAATLRKEGFGGRIVLVGDEAEQPYERPELSKKYLRGVPNSHVAVHEPGFYDTADIELRLGTPVDAIDVAQREVTLGSETIRFDRLLLATGSEPRRPNVRGAERVGVVTLRTRTDSDRIRERALQSESIVVVGGGWIASEVAASLRELDRHVTLLVPGRAPLQRILGEEVAGTYLAAHRDHGVDVRTGVRATEIRGRTRVSGVITDAGETIAADLVVLGIGVQPRSRLASEAGIATDDGVLVDEFLRTSVPFVFAAGDVANATHPRFGRRLRVEHWDNAKRQGRTAALNMLDRKAPYDRIPYFYSDQYDIGMEYTGYAPAWDDVVLRGDPRSGEFIAFWLRDGRVAAGMNVNVWDVAPAIRELVASRDRVERDVLTDVTRPLADVAHAA